MSIFLTQCMLHRNQADGVHAIDQHVIIVTARSDWRDV